MRLVKLALGMLSFIGALLVAAATWLTAVTWWYSADVLKGVQRRRR